MDVLEERVLPQLYELQLNIVFQEDQARPRRTLFPLRNQLD